MAKLKKPIVADISDLQAAPLATGNTVAFTPDLVEFGSEPMKKIDIGSLPMQDINERRAAVQSNFKAIANSVASIPAQFVGEAVSGVGYLGMTPDSIETPNFLVRLGEAITKVDDKALPVYSDAQSSEGFRPWDGEWWANNIPSIASSLSIFVPALGVSKALGMAGSLLKANKYIGKILAAIPEIGATAELLSATIPARHIESMMEATGTYEEAIAKGMTPSEAAQAAAQNYRLNWLATLTDLGQYASVMGIKLPGLPKLGLAGNLASESVEEFAQFVFNKESLLTNKEKQSTPFEVRLAEYMQDPEAQTSAFWGAFGGAVFQAGGKAIKRLADFLETRRNPSNAKKVLLEEVAQGETEVLDTIDQLAAENEADPKAVETFKQQAATVSNEPNVTYPPIADAKINQLLAYDDSVQLDRDFGKVLVNNQVPINKEYLYAAALAKQEKQHTFPQEIIDQLKAEFPTYGTIDPVQDATLNNHPDKLKFEGIADQYITNRLSSIKSTGDLKLANEQLVTDLRYQFSQGDYVDFANAVHTVSDDIKKQIAHLVKDETNDAIKRINLADPNRYETIEDFIEDQKTKDKFVKDTLDNKLFNDSVRQRIADAFEKKFASKVEVRPVTDDDFFDDTQEQPEQQVEPVEQEKEYTVAEETDFEYEDKDTSYDYPDTEGSFFVRGNFYQETPADPKYKYPKVLKRDSAGNVLAEGEFDKAAEGYDPNKQNRYRIIFMDGVDIPEASIKHFMAYPGKDIIGAKVFYKSYVDGKTTFDNTTKQITERNFPIVAFVEKDGVQYPVGNLSSLDYEEGPQGLGWYISNGYSEDAINKKRQDIQSLANLRKELWNKRNQTVVGEFAVSDYVGKVNSYDPGLLNTLPEKQSIDAVTNSDEKYIGVHIGGEVISNIPESLNPPVRFNKVKDGQLFIAKKIWDGSYKWVGAFPKRLGESSRLTELYNVLNRLAADNYDPVKEYAALNDKLKSIVRFKDTDGTYGPSIGPSTHLKFQVNDKFDPDTFIRYYGLLTRPIHVDYKKIGQKDYVDSLFKSGDIVTNIGVYPYVNPKFVVSRYGVEPVENKPKTGKATINPNLLKKYMRKVPGTKRINKKQAINNLRQIIPSGVSIKFLERLMDEHGLEVYGYVENATITLSDVAIASAEYHEAWHIIEDYILTPEEKESLHSQVNAEDKSEYLAEAFREFMLTKDTSLGYKIKRFFKYISELINTFLGYKPTIRGIFEKAARGHFKNKTVRFTAGERKYMRAMNSLDKRELGNAILTVAGNYFLDFANKNELKRAFNADPEKNLFLRTSTEGVLHYMILSSFINSEDFDLVKPNLLHYLQQLRGDITDFNVIEEEDGNYSVEIDTTGTPHVGQQVYAEIIKGIAKRGYKLRISVPEVIDHHTEELEDNEDGDVRENWMENIQLISYLERLSPEIKRIINGVQERADKLGLNVPINYSGYSVFSRILPVISQSLSVEEMINKMKASPDPFFADFMDYIDNRHNNPNEVYGKIFIAIGQQMHPRYLVVYKGVDKQNMQAYNTVYDSNRISLKAISSRLINNEKFRTAFTPTTSKEDAKLLFIDGGLGSKVLDLMPDNIFAELRKVLTPTPNEIKVKFSGSDTVAKRRKFLKMLREYYPYDYLEAHLNVEGKRQYEYINPAFITRLLASIKSDVVKNRYISDPMYQNLPILNDANIPFEFIMIDGLVDDVADRKVMYTDFTEDDTAIVLFNTWAAEDIYPFPVPSDSPNMIGVKLGKKKTVAEAIDDILILVKNEITRTTTGNRNGIENYTRNANMLVLFDYIQSYLTKTMGIDIHNATDDTLKQIIEKYVDRFAKDFANRTEDYTESLMLNKVDGADNLSKFKVFAANYISNYSQAMLLSSGDPAFYKGVEDYFKRAKQAISPVKKIDITASFKDKNGVIHSIPKRNMNITILRDIVAKANQYDEIKRALESIGKGDSISAYENVNHTDAQSYIDLHSYKWRELGLHRWSDAKELAFQYMLTGKGINEIMETGKRLYKNEFPNTLEFTVLKPYYFAHLILNDGQLVSPFQKKDSEFLITPFYGIEKFGKAKNPLYNPFYKKMMESMGYSFKNQKISYDENNRKTDMHSFDSAIKDGKRNVITTDDDFVASVSVPFDEWGLQQETPKHHYDTDDIFGTQIMKLIMSGNMNSDEYADLINAQDEYNRLLITDIEESYKEFQKEIEGATDSETFWNLISILRDELVNRGMRDEYIEALEKSGDKTKLPTWFPLHSYRIESLLFSLLRNRVTRQRFANGYSFVNTSSYGFKNQPKIKWVNNDPTQGIDYFEAYAPIHNPKLRKYVNEYGFIDEDGMQKIRESEDRHLLEGIVYRIPTESKYSMFKIKIIGFLPYDEGAIMLPQEVTTLAGLDFDIDKVRGFFKNVLTDKEIIGFAIKDNKEIWKQLTNLQKEEKAYLKDYKTERSTIVELKALYTVINEFAPDSISDNVMEDVDDRIGTLDDDYLIELNTRIAEIRVNISNLRSFLLEEGKKTYIYNKILRDNAKIELMDVALTNPKSLIYQIVPGGFDRVENAVHEIRFAKANTNPEEYSRDAKIKEILPYNSPETFIKVVQRMLAGKALVGIMANHNAVHALMQNKDLSLPLTAFAENGVMPVDLRVQYDDAIYSLKSVSRVLDITGNPISRNFAEMLAAVVDNGKKPMAEYFGLSLENSSTFNVFLHLGVPLETVMYLFANVQNVDIAKLPNGYNIEDHVIDINELKNNLYKPDEDVTTKYAHIVTYMRPYGKIMNDFINANKIADDGTGPTQISNIIKLQKKDLAISGTDSVIEGANDFFAQDTFINKLIDVIEKGNDYIVEKARLLPVRGSVIQTMLDNNPFKKRLTEDDANNIYRGAIAYFSSNTPFFAFNNNVRLKVHERLGAYKTKYPDNAFLSRLFYDGELDSLRFNGANSNDELEIQSIIDGWSELLQNEESKEFAKALAKYAFWMNGYSFSMNGFAHLMPISLFESIEELGQQYFEAIERANTIQLFKTFDHSSFFEQYIKSNYKDLIDSEMLRSLNSYNSTHNGRTLPYTIMLKEEGTRPVQFRYAKTFNGDTGLYKFDMLSGKYFLLKQNYAKYEGNTKIYQIYNYGFEESYVGESDAASQIPVNVPTTAPSNVPKAEPVKVIEPEYVSENIKSLEEGYDLKFENLSAKQIESLNEQLINSKSDYVFIGEKIRKGDFIKSEIKDFELGLASYVTTKDTGEVIYTEYIPTVYFEFESDGTVYKGRYSLANTDFNVENSFKEEYQKLVDKYYKVVPNIKSTSIVESQEEMSNIEQPVETEKQVSGNPTEYTNHSGGAYGGDTFWDTIGREFGVTNHKHYRDAGNTNLSQKLRNAGVKAEILTKEQMDFARQKVKEILGIEYSDNLKGNLQVRNFYQVYNSDAVYAIAKLNGSPDFNTGSVLGGTNTAVQLGIKLNKPVYLWDIDSEKWMKYEPNSKNGNDIGEFKPTETPRLTKNFAGVGSRDIENYNVQREGVWQPRKEYLGKEKEEKAKQAIRDVYNKTFAKTSEPVETEILGEITDAGFVPAIKQALADKSIEAGRYVKFNDTVYIVYSISGSKAMIMNPLLEGSNVNKQVNISNLTPMSAKATVVEYRNKTYFVTPKGAIISGATGSKMNWPENNGDRKAIYELAGYDPNNPLNADCNINRIK